ncbi:GD23589 [Drosophila simulans]|uniref:GD23589 n=1 Tax=Drosophila simulans TaxID=7240 RepID=B4Q7Q0_DROSI|nr:GD23589 [Drosophila simulans]
MIFSTDSHWQSLLAGRIPVASMTGPIKRGLLWQQRDRLFSRWKERYFVLTRDYLHCFKRASGSANERASDMGQFIFKVKRAYSDSQQRRLNNNNGPTPQPASPLAQRRNNGGLGSGVGSGAIYGTPTRV